MAVQPIAQTEQAAPSLDEQLRSRLRGAGSLSSADVAAAAVQEHVAPEPTQGDIKTALPASEYDDPLTKPTASSPHGSELAATTDTTPAEPLIDVEVTEEHRTRFLDALVTGQRYTQPFSIYGGRVHGVIRSRTQDETRCIIGQLQREIREKSILSDADYTVRLRAMLAAAQIESYQGADQGVLKAPLNWQRQPDGKETPPGWLDQAQGWMGLDEGLANAINEEIRLFELKYWTMVRHAHDQDFWQTAAST